MELVGNVALVTGGGRGIGKAITAELLSRGASVVVLEIEPEHATAAGDELAAVSDDGARLAFSIGSVTSAYDIDAAIKLGHERFGPITMLVNNAGTADMALTVDMPEEQWDNVVNTCLKGTFLVTKAWARQAIDNGKGGAIVNISSLNALATTDGMSHYCAAKAGIAAFTKVCAGEMGRYDIRANAIAPGTTETPLSAGFTVGKMGEAFLEATPLGSEPRHGQPQDIANVAAFLLSNLSSRMTGLQLPVDGGNHIRGLFSYWDKAVEEGLV